MWNCPCAPRGKLNINLRGNTMRASTAIYQFVSSLDTRTLSLCVPGPEPEPNMEYQYADVELGVCDITKVKGRVHWCSALTNEGELVYFQALDRLVNGPLANVAGY